MSSRRIFLSAVVAVTVLTVSSSHASDTDKLYVITLKNHSFSPQVLVVPVDQKIRVTIRNQDPTPAEFESNALNREKIVGANAEITVFVGPLKAGSYGYYDDFHKATTTGKVEAK